MTQPTNLSSLELLEKLRTLSRSYAEKEAKLLSQTQDGRTQAEQMQRRAVWDAEQKHEAAASKLDEKFQYDRMLTKDRYEARRKKIQQLHKQTVQNLPKMVDAARGRWLGQLQAKKNRTLRVRDELLDASQEARDTLHATQAENVQTLQACRRQGLLALVGFGGVRQGLETGTLTNGNAVVPPESLQQEALAATAALKSAALPKLFAALPFPGWLGIGSFVGILCALILKSPLAGILVGVGLVGLALLLYTMAKGQARTLAAKLANILQAGDAHTSSILGKADADHQAATEAAEQDYQAVKDEIDEKWAEVDGVQKTFEAKVRTKLEVQVPRVSSRNEALHASRWTALLQSQDRTSEQTKQQMTMRVAHADKVLADTVQRLQTTEKAGMTKLQADWDAEVPALAEQLAEFSVAVDRDFEPWSKEAIANWKAPLNFFPAIPLGAAEADLTLAGVDRPLRFGLPSGATLLAPVALSFPHCGSLRLETDGPCGGLAARVLFNSMLRLVASFPPGKIAFTILDPVGLGQNFAGLMHLADYEESLIHRRIWTQRSQMEERLAELNEHIEKVIQMYLRNEYATVSDYNALAGTTAEKYHFLVLADFPHGLSESGYQRLKSILLSGPRCGVFTLIHRDLRTPLPEILSEDVFHKNAIVLREKSGQFTAPLLTHPEKLHFQLEVPPAADLELQLIHAIGKASVDSNRVEVPFSIIAPGEGEVWSADTSQELKVAVGRTGATKFQQLAIGKGTKQHALFAGKTGSGKSTLFHVIITNLALWASPDEVEFYLIDFKKGVEFKCYATHQLPHARVVAIESDRAFGLSVLQRIDEELRRRGDLFRKANVQDLPGYRKAVPHDPMPRSLLLIDEFQEFFTEDDVVSQNAAVLFDRIVRQGRAFGIHVLLGSQTLGGAYTLARTTFGQMVIRVALMCNEADAHLIMDDSNSAPRLLTRPGEGIYNDMAGAIEGNSPFQVVWLPDAVRDAQLERVSQHAAASTRTWAKPIIFEGNAPADASDTQELADCFAQGCELQGASGRIWLGAPNSIKGPTEVTFRRQSGQHLLVVSQREEASLTLLCLAALALAGQRCQSQARILWLDSAAPASPDAATQDRLMHTAGAAVEMITSEQFATTFEQLHEALSSRTGPNHAPIFLLIPGLQRFKKLRQEDEFAFGSDDGAVSPSSVLNKLITEGPSVGIHLIISVDTFNNIGRWLSRKALSEFECRVVFQMSANDSASLVDSPAASQLGMHKAMLFHEQLGHSEVFRPYGPPENAWLEQVQGKLAK